jgi:hypothetical protein
MHCYVEVVHVCTVAVMAIRVSYIPILEQLKHLRDVHLFAWPHV